MVKLCLQGSGVKMTNQQLVAVGNLFAPGAGKTDSPLTSPCCCRQRHRHRHHCRPSLGMPSHELSIITHIDRGGVAALIVVASLMMYNTHLPSILYYMAQKKQHFVHAKSGKSCPHCLPYHIKIIFFIFVNINLFEEENLRGEKGRGCSWTLPVQLVPRAGQSLQLMWENLPNFARKLAKLS